MQVLFKITKDMNNDIPNGVGPASARGLSKMLDKLAKSQGRSCDVMIDMDCTVGDIFRASVRNGIDGLAKQVAKEAASD